LQSNLSPDIGAISSQKVLIVVAILFKLSMTNTKKSVFTANFGDGSCGCEIVGDI
jgi:hypothetical protein